MAIFGLRLDIFLVVWFISMGMVNYLDASTGVLNYQRDAKYNISEIAEWNGIAVGSENTSAYGYIEPYAEPENSGFTFLDTFAYGYKAFTFFTGTLWNASFGFHTFIRDTFGVPYFPWGLPLMIMINLMNFLGLIELMTKVKV